MKLFIEVPESYYKFALKCSESNCASFAESIIAQGITVEKERPTGEWVKEFADLYYCSRCRSEPFGDNHYHYCPNCGAKMKGETNNG